MLPGEYWLREDVNPLGFVKETSEANAPVYSTAATVVSGFDALAQVAATPAGVAKTITLTSKAFKDSNKPTYKIVSGPGHGSLGAINSEGKVTYTPTAGFTGPDSFTFSASDASSKFPEHPQVATVSIEVTSSTQPAVTIEGAPASMTTGASVQLTAKVVNDAPEVTWAASAGSITTAGKYTAPAEVPAGGTVTVTATTSKGAKDSKTIEITPPGGTKGLLAGDATATYTVSDQTTAGREEAFQFTAKSTGTVEELLFRTNATANTGVTGVVLAVFAENGGKPGAVLGQGTASGTPAVSSWIKVSGLAVPVSAGTKYWLVALPTGSGKLHYNAAVGSGGTGNVESTAGGMSTATAQSAWETFNQGPVGFQANGTVGEAPASVTIEGAPASMNTGASVQLTAKVTNDSPTVTWAASAGTITAEGKYTAPEEVPAGGKVTVTATTSKGAKAEKTIEITAPVPSVTIEGAPASMNTGASVQLTAKVTNDSPTVTWAASAGTITAEGKYTAPESVPAGGKATITATTSKGAKAEKTIEITAPVPSVTIEGAPASMTTGSSVQLTAKVANDSPTVTWAASAGTITAEGKYTAPEEVPAGGKVTVTATTSKGAKAEKTIEIKAPVPSVTIEGAPASMTTGSSVQLTAKVTNDSPTVTWAASAGTITAEGKYTAPESVPAGGKATITATTSKGAKAEKTIEITPVAGTKELLVGDATATYAVSDQTTAGREEGFQFTAKATGTVEELLFRTNATANTGVTGVILAVFAENAGKPGQVLGSGTASGTPAVSSWIKVSGLSISVTSGTKYWLVALPLGSGKLHFNASKGSGAGTGNVETTAGGMTKATVQTSWESYGQGPVGFQANGATSGGAAIAAARAGSAAPAASTPAGRLAVAGPQVMTAGTAAQLSAVTGGDTGPVTWTASAGQVSSSGVFIAPRVERPTAVTVGASAAGAKAQTLQVTVDPVHAGGAAPTAASVSATGVGGRGQALGALSAMIFNRQLVVTTAAGQAGVVTILARAGHRLLGSCSEPTQAGVGVTCRVSLRGSSPRARIAVSAVLRSGHRVLGSRRAAGVAVPMMRLMAKLPGIKGGMSSMFSYICSPALRTGGPGGIASLP